LTIDEFNFFLEKIAATVAPPRRAAHLAPWYDTPRLHAADSPADETCGTAVPPARRHGGTTGPAAGPHIKLSKYCSLEKFSNNSFLRKTHIVQVENSGGSVRSNCSGFNRLFRIRKQ
jgi:hypothetical protein